MLRGDTIVAAATPTGGALSIVRVSGPGAISIVDSVFNPAKGSGLSSRKSFSITYGEIIEDEEVIDDVLISIFRSPNSYTGEDMAEISCHGSAYIVLRIIELLIRRGARSAEAGEFTSRAFLAGKMDLSQAEAVADMISSHDRATHSMAVNQMRGGYSEELGLLRRELLRLASLLELELDFSEEDVEFADRRELSLLIGKTDIKLGNLIDSFSLGNAIKSGIGVAIAGSPNVGKSTLLNALLNEDRAMVSDIAGTTRDVIEESMVIDGVHYRFIDTAGIRSSDDVLEQMGIQRTYRSIEKAPVLFYLFDLTSGVSAGEIDQTISSLHLKEGQKVCVVLNKCDEAASSVCIEKELKSAFGYDVISISAKYAYNIEAIKEYLSSLVDSETVFRGDAIVSNSRHYEALLKSRESLYNVGVGINSGLSGDLLAEDVRQALYWLGTITGEITTDEILGEIFSKFCIGK